MSGKDKEQKKDEKEGLLSEGELEEVHGGAAGQPAGEKTVAPAKPLRLNWSVPPEPDLPQ